MISPTASDKASDKAPTPKTPSSPIGAAGFEADLSGMDLWDLVQMECMSGATRVIRVEARDAHGLLYFRGGHLVHAVCGDLEGDAAAIHVLQLRNGRYRVCGLPQPDRPTVTTPVQGLLLRAAQIIDGGEPRRTASGVRRLGAGHTELAEASPDPMGQPVAQPAEPILFAEQPSHTERTDPAGWAEDCLDLRDYVRLAWLDHGGQVQRTVGHDHAFVADSGAAARLAAELGQLLSLGRFASLVRRSGAQSVLAYDDGQGGVVACVPASDAVVEALCRRLEL